MTNNIPNTTPEQRKVYYYLDGGSYRAGFPRTLPLPKIVKNFIPIYFNSGLVDYQVALDSSDRRLMASIIPETAELRRTKKTISPREYDAVFRYLDTKSNLSDLWNLYKTALPTDTLDTFYSILFSSGSSATEIVQTLIVAHANYISKIIVNYERTYGEIILPGERSTSLVLPLEGIGGSGIAPILQLQLLGTPPSEYEDRTLIAEVYLGDDLSAFSGAFVLSIETKPVGGQLYANGSITSGFVSNFNNGQAIVLLRFSKSGAWKLKLTATSLNLSKDVNVVVLDKATTELLGPNYSWENNNPVAATFVNCDGSDISSGIDLASCGTGF